MQKDNPDSLRSIASDSAAIVSLRDRATGIVAFTMVLALLHFGRDVLIPFTVALMLSLLIAPLVRALRRTGLGQILSVLVAVLAPMLSDPSRKPSVEPEPGDSERRRTK
jgi:hypothetical protein